jgi:urea transport system ATP-binding protein
VTETSPVLYLDGVTVSFDGFKALNALSLVIEPGEMRAIIGPNGAGKTTMMDVVTGKTRPDSGTVLFEGTTNLLKQDEAAIANLGIGRKFQKPTVFENHTVRDNVALALKLPRGVLPVLGHRPSGEENDRIAALIEEIGLAGKPISCGASTRRGRSWWWSMTWASCGRSA